MHKIKPSRFTSLTLKLKIENKIEKKNKKIVKQVKYGTKKITSFDCFDKKKKQLVANLGAKIENPNFFQIFLGRSNQATLT
jgi:hypothetical protein